MCLPRQRTHLPGRLTVTGSYVGDIRYRKLLSIPPYIWYDVINNYRSTVLMVLRVRTGRCALLESELQRDDRNVQRLDQSGNMDDWCVGFL